MSQIRQTAANRKKGMATDASIVTLPDLVLFLPPVDYPRVADALSDFIRDVSLFICIIAADFPFIFYKFVYWLRCSSA